MNISLPLGRHFRGDRNLIFPFGRRASALLLWLVPTLLMAVPSARGELNKEEQAKVNQAIDKGVAYLKQQQLAVGTWPSPENKHSIGYAALPGLTLLESGVPADDPAIKKIALLVRQYYLGIDGTYEIALCILFLDRLGDPNDKKIIQTLAVRLVAGQTASGGWPYTCPIINLRVEKDLLTTLQKLPALPPLIVDQNGKIDTGASTNSPGSSSSENGKDQSTGDTSSTLEVGAFHFSRQNYCIKALEPAPVPSEAMRAAREKQAAKPPFIPAQLRGLPIFIDPQKLVMFDTPDKKTDNSNTQFAILALWAAQRYDVPTQRTLRLMVRRFQVSQNANGSWHYHFFLGGTTEGWGPQMTAVGLLGLAVGHGLAAPARGAGPRVQAKDPTILKGFVALNQAIGQPTGRMQGIPQNPSLYYLWSLERVGVLYNLDRIGDKDWYRWGAEILVANQQPAGNWKDGKYHGATPTLDTCLALLFLQRANLAKDLGDKLPFNPADLNTAVTDQARKDADKLATGGQLIDEKKPEPSPPMVVPSPMMDTKDETAEKKETKPEPEQKPDTTRTSSTPAAAPEAKRKIWPYFLLGVGGVMLLGFGVFLAIYLRGGAEEEKETEDTPRTKKKVAKKSIKR